MTFYTWHKFHICATALERIHANKVEKLKIATERTANNEHITSSRLRLRLRLWVKAFTRVTLFILFFSLSLFFLQNCVHGVWKVYVNVNVYDVRVFISAPREWKEKDGNTHTDSYSRSTQVHTKS